MTGGACGQARTRPSVESNRTMILVEPEPPAGISMLKRNYKWQFCAVRGEKRCDTKFEIENMKDIGIEGMTSIRVEWTHG